MSLKSHCPKAHRLVRLALRRLRQAFRPVTPQELGRHEVRVDVLLVEQKTVAPSVWNRTSTSVPFVYAIPPVHKEVLERISCPRQPKQLPVILSLD
jgi:hypothetical protein